MALDELPELLTVTEAAQVLRISRTTAYAEANRYLRTGDGLPVIRVGRSLRAPRERLRRWIDSEPLSSDHNRRSSR
jgi:excisionase family DNA binding protein